MQGARPTVERAGWRGGGKGRWFSREGRTYLQVGGSPRDGEEGELGQGI